MLALTCLVASCASQPPSDGGKFGKDGKTTLPTCKVLPGPLPPCSGDKNDPKVTIDLDTFDLVPKCVNAKKRKFITFTFVASEKPDAETVVVYPKDPANYVWLAATNAPSKNKIKIEVPDDIEAGEYEYGIYYDGECLDPRVRVLN